MSAEQSPTNHSPEPSLVAQRSQRTQRTQWAFRLRVLVFGLVLLGCGIYSGFFRSIWTNRVPNACADGNMALFFVDFNEFPARLGEQFNVCTGVADGQCTRMSGDQVIRGECQKERMQGAWSLHNTKLGTTSWSGTYCNGLPCGEFHRRRVDVDVDDSFRIENMHVHGPATLWEPDGSRWLETAGRFDRGKRIGRWTRHVAPAHVLHSVMIYDENGFLSTTSLYCTNGYRKEIRGKSSLLYDPQGNLTNPTDPPACPLP